MDASNPGETIEETAHRELLEETGATLKDLEVLCYIHCFMYNLEYWGIAYLGEIKELGSPLDLNEVSEAKLFSYFQKTYPIQDPLGIKAKRYTSPQSVNYQRQTLKKKQQLNLQCVLFSTFTENF